MSLRSEDERLAAPAQTLVRDEVELGRDGDVGSMRPVATASSSSPSEGPGSPPFPMVMPDSVVAAVRIQDADRASPLADQLRPASVAHARSSGTLHGSMRSYPHKTASVRSSSPPQCPLTAGGSECGVALDDDVDVPVRSPASGSGHYRAALRNLLHLLRPTAPVLDSQIYMTAGAVTLSFLLVAFSVLFRLEVYDRTSMNAGLVFGSAGSIAMCSIIIGAYLLKPWYRRHMHILLLNLALCEFLLALSFLLEPVWTLLDAGVGPGRSCTWLSTLREYLIMCSTVWTTCMALDLYYLMTDPFTSPRMNRRKYRVLSNSIAAVAAIVMAVCDAFDAPVAVGNFCWVGAQREAHNDAAHASRLGVWLFIVAPVGVSMGTNVYVTFVSYNRFRDGLAATLRNRHVLLREGFLTTVTFIVYSALLWGVYAGYWLAGESSTQSEVLSVLFSFLLSYRGSVAFILWCLYKKPDQKAAAAVAATTTSPTGHASREEEEEESEDAVRPQMNVALLEELVQYTTQGIATAVRLLPSLPEASAANTFTLRSASSRVSSWNEIKFTDFRPAAFARLRKAFGIQDADFLASLAQCTTPKVSEGASGSFMFYSADRSFIVKSLTAAESAFLHSLLDRYSAYMTSQPHTCLTRFLGSYCIALYGTKAYFAVMENVFDVQHGVSIHQRYDIKGSWIARNAQKPRRGAEATCRHCNLTFRFGTARGGSSGTCPNRAGSHEPNVVLKDMDLTTKLRFGPVEGKRLLKQLKRDSDFLCELGIMDYSLLLGVIEVSYQVNRQNILTRDGSVFLDAMLHETADATATTNARVKQSSQCLRTSEVVIGPGFYYIGIIDILQTWNWTKRVERFVKTVLLRQDADGISAMPPKAYRSRFHRKLEDIIHLGHNVVLTPKNSSVQASPTNDASSRILRAPHRSPSFGEQDDSEQGSSGSTSDGAAAAVDAGRSGHAAGPLAGQVRASLTGPWGT